ncbi:RES family NAD+ phosphorylase, partial [Vibrio parahaemolyticus]|uniref:RES family NAD+ phosphorylase n=1 Tax=Vibrio parahaemolyticus TaxID=670 RepID=UPI001A908D0F
WYAALEVETALAEVAFHLTRALREAGSFEAQVEWAELWASLAGESVDLRGVGPRPRCLDPDPIAGYPAGCALAGPSPRKQRLGALLPEAVKWKIFFKAQAARSQYLQ